MKKKIIALALAAVMVVLTLGLASCTGGDNTDPAGEGGTNAAKNGTLTVGFDAEFPPMGFKDDNGNYVGFDLDLAKEVAKRLNMDIKLQAIDWNSKDAELKNGNIDLIWNGFTMTGRENDYTWSKPYMKNQQVIVVLNNSKITKLADLKGKKLALQLDSSAEKALNAKADFKASLGKVLTTSTNLDALNELKMGSVDAVLMDEIVAQYNITKQGGNYKVLEEALAEEEYAVGFLKGNTELRDKVQAQIDAMAKDGTLSKISKEWFGKDVTVSNS